MIRALYSFSGTIVAALLAISPWSTPGQNNLDAHDMKVKSMDIAICRGRPGGMCSNKAIACAYDKDCGDNDKCEWVPAFGARFVDNGNQTVTDRKTCLTWEKKTGTVSGLPDPNDPHNVNNQYTWATSDPWRLDGTVATEFLANLNGSAFAGHTDWRLPTSMGRPEIDCGGQTCATGNDPELESIFLAPCAQDGSTPCIDPIFGPNQGGYWSGSSNRPVFPYSAWIMYYGPPYSSSGAMKDYAFSVRAVRGGI